MPDKNEVTISLEKYNRLITLETRVDVVVQRIIREGYIDTQEILWIIGTDDATEFAQELKHKEDLAKEEYLRMHEEINNA